MLLFFGGFFINGPCTWTRLSLFSRLVTGTMSYEAISEAITELAAGMANHTERKMGVSRVNLRKHLATVSNARLVGWFLFGLWGENRSGQSESAGAWPCSPP